MFISRPLLKAEPRVPLPLCLVGRLAGGSACDGLASVSPRPKSPISSMFPFVGAPGLFVHATAQTMGDAARPVTVDLEESRFSRRLARSSGQHRQAADHDTPTQ